MAIRRLLKLPDYLAGSIPCYKRVAMSSAKATKLRRLDQFRRRLPYASASALSAVLKDIEEHGAPELHDRKDFKSARDATAASETPYGPFLQTIELEKIDSTMMPFIIVLPFAMLWFLMSTVNKFSDVAWSRLAEHPASADLPWSLILHSDEITPGNVLAHDVRRKSQAVYYSFLELGSDVLCNEDAWFCVTAKRSSELKPVKGCMAQVFGRILHIMFGGSGSNFHEGGVQLQSPSGAVYRFHAKLAIILQDGSAHKYTWHCKGDAGMKMCMLCRNVFTRSSTLVDEDGSELLACDIIDESKLDIATDAQLKKVVRDLNRHKATDPPPFFKFREQAYGFTFQPYSLLADMSLDAIIQPASQFMHDWMHAMFVSGIFHTLMHLLMEALRDGGLADTYETLRGYVALWNCPVRVHMSTLSECFAPSKRKVHMKDKRFKCTASEGLTLYSIIALYLALVCIPAGVAVKACTVSLAFADAVDAIVGAQYKRSSPNLIRKCVGRFLKLYVELWGYDRTHQEFHGLPILLPIWKDLGRFFHVSSMSGNIA